MAKILTTLREQRQVEEEIRLLAASRTQADFEQRARWIVSQDQALPALLSSANSAGIRMLGVLGSLATMLDRDTVVHALYQAAVDRSRPDRGRLITLLILERFLGEELSEELFEGLEEPEDLFIQSLVSAVGRAETSRLPLLDLVHSLAEQQPEVVLSVIDTLVNLDTPATVEPLRTLAQDPRDEIARHAIRALATMRYPQAVKALQILRYVSSPSVQHEVERALRKQRLRGLEIVPLPRPDGAWRTLVSAVDGQGNQSVWFLGQGDGEGTCRLLAAVINYEMGITKSLGDEHAPAHQFPARLPLGTVHEYSPGNAGHLRLLETDFEYGRYLVGEAQKNNAHTGTPTPLVYRLINDFIWSYQIPPDVPRRLTPALAQDGASARLAESGRLLDHPDFATWFVESPAVYDLAAQLRQWRHPQHTTLWREAIHQLVESHFDERVLNAYRTRLLAMAEWLARAGDEETARIVLTAADGLLK
ncbi:MAG: HEAT repeat domain-containing protein, partial [Chloroflexota bacterium]|nr:HEAT repeat domain-containing protein [Chloroflexota bacterium]